MDLDSYGDSYEKNNQLDSGRLKSANNLNEHERYAQENQIYAQGQPSPQ